MAILISVSLLDEQRVRTDDRGQHFRAAPLHEPLDRAPRHAHPQARLLLLEPLQIAEPHRLQLTQLQAHRL
jgi:hypothetical protein